MSSGDQQSYSGSAASRSFLLSSGHVRADDEIAWAHIDGRVIDLSGHRSARRRSGRPSNARAAAGVEEPRNQRVSNRADRPSNNQAPRDTASGAPIEKRLRKPRLHRAEGHSSVGLPRTTPVARMNFASKVVAVAGRISVTGSHHGQRGVLSQKGSLPPAVDNPLAVAAARAAMEAARRKSGQP